MPPKPTGEITKTESGRDLTLTRTFPFPADQLWPWVAESPLLEKWFGTWTGPGGGGSQFKVTMNAEEEEVTSDGEIVACTPGDSYEVRVSDDYGSWHLEISVEDTGQGSRLIFIHHLDDETNAGQVGAGWEYYLDRLKAAIEEAEMPDFNVYWPAMGPYFEGL